MTHLAKGLAVQAAAGLAGLILSSTLPATAATLYVSSAAGVNSGTCTVQNSPCKTISYAMTQAAAGSPGDTINVSPGTYDTIVGETFPIVVKSGVTLRSTGTAHNTVIDAFGTNKRVMQTAAGANAATLIEGFTISGGLHSQAGADSNGGGIFIDGGSPAIRRNIISNNEARGPAGLDALSSSGGWANGGGIYASGATPTIVNNVLVGNVVRGGDGFNATTSFGFGGYGGWAFGGGIYLAGTGGTIANNTLRGNQARGGNGGSSPDFLGGNGGSAAYGGLYANGATVKNNILAANEAWRGLAGSGSPPGMNGGSAYGAMTVDSPPAAPTHNLFHGNLVEGAPSADDTIGNNSQCDTPTCPSVGFFSDPNDLRITPMSPANDTGTAIGAPANDLLGVIRGNPPSIGAYEASDPTLTYNLVLEGWQQVSPYVVTPAGGTGTATYNQVTRQLALNLPYSGLTGSEAMAHIHGPGARGVNAGIIFTLAASNPKIDSFILNGAQEAMLLAGELYVNIHTSTYGNGEIRAQIDNLGATLTHVLTVSRAGTGVGTVNGTAEPGTVIACGSDCSETVPFGKSVALTPSAGAGSTFTGWSGDCTGTGACNPSMTQVRTVTATFSLNSYTVTPSAGANGAISPNIGQTVNHGATTSFTVTPNTGYSIGTVTGCGGSLAGNTYTTAAITANCTVSATFTVNTYTVTPVAGANGAIAPSTPQTVAHGATTSFTVTPNVNFEIDAVTGCGGSLTGNTYTTGAITAACTVTAAFVAASPPRLGNISTRMQVLTGNDVMIGGFVIGGTGNKRLAIVATGPSLAAFGITNPLSNPTLTLVRSSDQTVIAGNDDWQSAINAAQLQAAGFAPSHALEAAILVDLAPGAYTAIVQGVDGGTGVSVIGVYEVTGATIPLVNISTRGRVLTGNDVMIGGFVIQGTGPRTVAIVATGPSLAAFGIANPLANPTITLVRSSDQAVIGSNDDWQADANAAQLQAAGFAPTNALESGLLVTLPPGAYTVIVQGVGGGTGVAVIGVYAVN